MTEYSSYIQYYLYIIAFFFFILIYKFGLKKRLNYTKVAIAGFILGLSLDMIIILYYQIFNAFVMGSIFADAIICAVLFLILYLFSKLIYDWIRRKK